MAFALIDNGESGRVTDAAEVQPGQFVVELTPDDTSGERVTIDCAILAIETPTT